MGTSMTGTVPRDYWGILKTNWHLFKFFMEKLFVILDAKIDV